MTNTSSLKSGMDALAYATRHPDHPGKLIHVSIGCGTTPHVYLVGSIGEQTAVARLLKIVPIRRCIGYLTLPETHCTRS